MWGGVLTLSFCHFVTFLCGTFSTIQFCLTCHRPFEIIQEADKYHKTLDIEAEEVEVGGYDFTNSAFFFQEFVFYF